MLASKARATEQDHDHHRRAESPSGESNPKQGGTCPVLIVLGQIHMLRLCQVASATRSATTTSVHSNALCTSLVDKANGKRHDQFKQHSNQPSGDEVKVAGDEVVRRLRRAAMGSQPTASRCERGRRQPKDRHASEPLERVGAGRPEVRFLLREIVAGASLEPTRDKSESTFTGSA